MDATDAVRARRRGVRAETWGDTFAALSAADAEQRLGGDELERLGTAAFLLGKETEAEDALTRAYQAFLGEQEAARAARCAFWLGMALHDRGESARGQGWLARAQRIVDEELGECVEAGYLHVPAGLRSLTAGDTADALTLFGRAAEYGSRFGDVDLATLGRLGQGQAKVLAGDSEAGLALLDEAMVAVTAGEVSSIPAGIVYCAVISACHEFLDLRRAQEWTSALSRWCEAQPDLVPYRGQCLVHRAQILQWRGLWNDALREAARAGEWLSRPRARPALGAAFYQQAEIRRLRGELAAAETAYRQAHACGHDPQPGLALLRLAQGRVDLAAAGIRGVAEAAGDRPSVARLLPGYVEVMLAAGRPVEAREAADRLGAQAGRAEATPLLVAMAAYAQGAVLLGEGDPAGALDRLGTSLAAWQQLDSPYEVARCRVLLGRACRALGDEESARLQLSAAEEEFRRLGAGPAAAEARRLAGRHATAGGLTTRELEVLRLVAAGRTNREIAAQLVLSEKTVARHLSNIFTKLSVGSRSAATAYAFQHDLV